MERAIRKIVTADDKLNRIQDSLKTAIDPILSDRFNNKKVLTVTIGATATKIAHSLGYEPQGFLVINKNKQGDVWLVSKDASAITLQSSVADSMATIYLF